MTEKLKLLINRILIQEDITAINFHYKICLMKFDHQLYTKIV